MSNHPLKKCNLVSRSNKITSFKKMKRSLSQNAAVKGFPGGPVIENPPARAGHAASAPGPGGSCMSQATQPACLSS